MLSKVDPAMIAGKLVLAVEGSTAAPAAGAGSAPAIASKLEAEDGTDNTKMMTPLRTKQTVTAMAQAAGWAGAGGLPVVGPVGPTGPAGPTGSVGALTSIADGAVGSVVAIPITGQEGQNPVIVTPNAAGMAGTWVALMPGLYIQAIGPSQGVVGGVALFQRVG